ncbi:hypothetical protein C6I20_00230 [Aeromicrobium sp. A1-2]|uniref:FMN-binding protein n=1 Tax=Aeromicrobium sp. A1-2 TaxID=2107713 RepID=UPI000E4D5C6E|nr:FMN-binding protein [Aeromicrobium sp. A1-2]AXT83776.1 hypothetical protein C6I20_00230 [Aeromicrobium sp. A1-2]
MKLPAHKKMLSAAAAASVLLLTAACGGGSGPVDATPSASGTSAATGDSATSNATYEDGDYEGEGSYSNPSGISEVKVDVTLKDGKISAVEVTPEATDGTSRRHQQDFAGGIAGEVVGKSINDLNVGAVAGSSLTAGGFNEAIEQIKAEAQA